MSTAPDFHPHYTLADYEQWDGDWELWKGTAVAMSPAPTPAHQMLAGKLAFALQQAIAAANCQDCVVLPEVDWRIADDLIVRPDIAVTCDPLPPNRLESPPRLIVEVLSASTVLKDRTAKHELYRSQGVRYYLLADPGATPDGPSTTEAWQLVAGRYQALDLSQPQQLTLHDRCEIELKLG